MQSSAKPGAPSVWETEGMIRRERIPICLAAIIVVLFVPMWLGCMWDDAFASEQAAIMNEGSGPADIRIAKGKLSGSFNNRPLFEVLDAIRSKAGFEYQGYKEVLGYAVSGKFEGSPLIDAVEKMLEPFNYMIIFNADGEIERLHIVSFRGASARSVARGARVPPQTTSPEPTYADAPPESGPATEQPLLLDVAVDKLAPRPELLDDFEPGQEPASAETGRQISTDTVVEDLPEIQVLLSDTGPVDLDMVVEELAEPEPFLSEPGLSPDGPEKN